MLEAWTGEVKARCHVAQIKMKELADECGYNPAYLSEVINGNMVGIAIFLFIVLLVLFVFALCSEFKQAEQEGERMAAEFTARRNRHEH